MKFRNDFGWLCENDITIDEYDLARIVDRFTGMIRPYGDRKMVILESRWMLCTIPEINLLRELVIHYGWWLIINRDFDGATKVVWETLIEVKKHRSNKKWKFTRLSSHGLNAT